MNNPGTRALLIRFASHRRGPFLRLAILILGAWLMGEALVPHTGSFSDASGTRPHLHAIGDRLERAHDELACPACNAHQVAIWTRTPLRPVVGFARKIPPASEANVTPTFADHIETVFARGPPSAS